MSKGLYRLAASPEMNINHVVCSDVKKLNHGEKASLQTHQLIWTRPKSLFKTLFVLQKSYLQNMVFLNKTM